MFRRSMNNCWKLLTYSPIFSALGVVGTGTNSCECIGGAVFEWFDLDHMDGGLGCLGQRRRLCACGICPLIFEDGYKTSAYPQPLASPPAHKNHALPTMPYLYIPCLLNSSASSLCPVDAQCLLLIHTAASSNHFVLHLHLHLLLYYLHFWIRKWEIKP